MTALSPGWQRGFGLAHLLPGGHVRQYPVITDGGVAVVEGHVFKAKAPIPAQDIKTNWLESFRG